KPAQPKRIPTKKIKTKSKGAFFELVPLTHDNFPTVGSLILYKGIKLVLLEDAESQAQKNEFQKQIDQINAAIKRYNKQQPPKKFWGRGKRAETIYDRIAEELENWVNPPLFEEE
ncbi:MAG TPA: hypothetical protein VFF04_05265, partial [Candidatus Babeliales bacterium]|nr:hypothetical protein [Candidatus Babeliales bacterium]